MSRVERKPPFCICENKDADQLRGNHEADQRLCFRYKYSTIPLLPKYKILSLYPACVVVQPGIYVGPGGKPGRPVYSCFYMYTYLLKFQAFSICGCEDWFVSEEHFSLVKAHMDKCKLHLQPYSFALQFERLSQHF